MGKNMCKTKNWQFRSHKERVESLLKSKNGPPIRTAHYFCHHQVYVHYLPSNTSSFSTQSSNLCFFKLGTLSTLNFLDFTLSHCTPGTSKTNTPSCNVTLHFYFGSNASATLVFHIYHSSPHFVFITHQGGFLGWELLFFFYLWQNATKETRFSLPTIELATFFQVSTSVVADHPLIACPSSH